MHARLNMASFYSLGYAYALVLIPLVIALIRHAAPWRRRLAAPLIAIPALAFTLVFVGLLQSAWIGQGGTLPSRPVLDTLTAALCLVIGYLAGIAASRATPDGRYLRGTRVLAPAEVRTLAQRLARVHRREHPVTVAGITIPPADETKHFKFIGTTGTGKSTAIRELLEVVLDRGDRVVIADPDGGYRQRFFDERRDRLLNPFEPAAQAWDLFGEIRTSYDVEQLARSLIPDHEGPDRIWRSYARTFFTAVTRQLHDAEVRELPELYRLLTAATPEELRLIVAGTPAQPFLEEGNERMFGSIRSVTGASLTAFEHLANQRAEPLSVRDWIRREGEGSTRALFLPYQADQIAALRSIISTWLRLAIFQTMSQGERDHRLWFIVDELDALGTIDGLKDALARLRKFGGRCVLGFQSIAQVSGTYGNAEAHTIVENCANSLILRCSASEGGGTARFASELIGRREMARLHASESRRAGFFERPSRTLSRSEQRLTEEAVMASEIEQLPDLHGYLKLASRPEWLRVAMPTPR